MATTIDELRTEVEQGLHGPGYITHTLNRNDEGVVTSITATFIPMPDGRFETSTTIETVEVYVEEEKFIDGEHKMVGVVKPLQVHIVTGRYYTDEENAQRDAEEAAYEPVRLAKLKAAEIEQAVIRVTPELVAAFNELPRLAKAQFAPIYDAVELRLSKGRIEDALDIVETAPDQDETKVVKQKIHTILTTLLANLSFE